MEFHRSVFPTTRRPPRVTTSCWITLTLLAIYIAYLLILAVSLSPEAFAVLFSESGPFQQMSLGLWLGLAAVLLASRSPAEAAMAVLALLAAAREADWHKAFTVDGLTKISTYLNPAVPWQEKVIGITMLALALGSSVYLTVRLYRYLFLRQGSVALTGQILVIAVVLLPLSKVLDRSPSILRKRFDIVLPQNIDQVLVALEEGIEMLVPVLLIVALLLSHTEAQIGSLAKASPRKG